MKCSFKYCNSKINHDAQSGMCGSDCNFDADISVCNWEDVSGGGEDNFDWSVARGSLKPWTGEIFIAGETEQRGHSRSHPRPVQRRGRGRRLRLH